MTFSDLFKVMIIQRQTTSKWYNIQLYLQWPTRPIESRIWSIERHIFQWPWTTPTPGFKVTPFIDTEYLRNGTTYRHIIGILIGTYTRPTQQCHFEWPWMTLSDLAKYSMTRSVAQSLCDSWASCHSTRVLKIHRQNDESHSSLNEHKVCCSINNVFLCW